MANSLIFEGLDIISALCTLLYVTYMKKNSLLIIILFCMGMVKEEIRWTGLEKEANVWQIIEI